MQFAVPAGVAIGRLRHPVMTAPSLVNVTVPLSGAGRMVAVIVIAVPAGLGFCDEASDMVVAVPAKLNFTDAPLAVGLGVEQICERLAKVCLWAVDSIYGHVRVAAVRQGGLTGAPFSFRQAPRPTHIWDSFCIACYPAGADETARGLFWEGVLGCAGWDGERGECPSAFSELEDQRSWNGVRGRTRGRGYAPTLCWTAD